jgi:hypothetical protein
MQQIFVMFIKNITIFEFHRDRVKNCSNSKQEILSLLTLSIEHRSHQEFSTGRETLRV